MINVIHVVNMPLPYGPHPTTPGDPSTPHFDGSQVQFSSFFNSEFKFLPMSQTFILHSSHIGPTPMMPWGGSPTARQTLTWSPLPTARY
jgi:hypothetical protein